MLLWSQKLFFVFSFFMGASLLFAQHDSESSKSSACDNLKNNFLREDRFSLISTSITHCQSFSDVVSDCSSSDPDLFKQIEANQRDLLVGLENRCTGLIGTAALPNAHTTPPAASVDSSTAPAAVTPPSVTSPPTSVTPAAPPPAAIPAPTPAPPPVSSPLV